MNNSSELRQLLAQHTGSQQVFRHTLARGVCYTDDLRLGLTIRVSIRGFN